MYSEENIVSSESELEQLIGEPMDFLRAKIVATLDETMLEFIQRSPLVFVSTVDANGRQDISPKGDLPGFVHVEDGQLQIPERPGNKLTFGFRNILRNPQIGLIFVVPNMRETLRVKGRAVLHKEPAVLQRLSAQNKPALLCTQIDVEECFFHCGKAMIRSKMWQPEQWEQPGPALMARHTNQQITGDPEVQPLIEEELERSYREDLY